MQSMQLLFIISCMSFWTLIKLLETCSSGSYWSVRIWRRDILSRVTCWLGENSICGELPLNVLWSCSCNRVGVAGFWYFGYMLGKCALVIDLILWVENNSLFTPWGLTSWNHPPFTNNVLLWIFLWAFIDTGIVPSVLLKCSSLCSLSGWKSRQKNCRTRNTFNWIVTLCLCMIVDLR